MENKNRKQELYTSPEVEVVEVKAGQVICQSGTTQQYGDGSTSDWFNN